MANKLFKYLAAGCVLVVLSVSSGFASFTEGKDYVRLEKPIPNGENTFIAIFSYDCTFCYRYDKTVMQQVVSRLPANLTYRPFHMKTRGKYGAYGSELFAVLLRKDLDAGLNDRELYSDQSALKKAKTAYYQAYHDSKERWDSGPEAFLQTGLDAVGMSRAEFDAARHAPEVTKLLDEWDVSYEVARIWGVPSFVVNGKYLINNKSIKSLETMLELINDLANK